MAELGLRANFSERGEAVGSGKLDTPCERMQSAKFTTSCCAWANVWWPTGLDALDVEEVVGEFEPHAAITTAAAIAAAATERLDVVLSMRQVVSGRGSHECNTPVPTRSAAPGRGV
jgi:hypothetical protein